MGMQSYRYSYDANVYLTSVTKPSGTTGFHIEPSLPNLQYRITVTDPLGFSEEYLYTGMLSGTYRDKNQYLQSWVATTYSYALVSGEGVVSQIAYDGNRNITSIADGLGRPTAIIYNQFGQPETIADANTQVRTFDYDASHRLTSITQNGNTLLTIVPDAVGRVSSATDTNGYIL